MQCRRPPHHNQGSACGWRHVQRRGADGIPCQQHRCVCGVRGSWGAWVSWLSFKQHERNVCAYSLLLARCREKCRRVSTRVPALIVTADTAALAAAACWLAAAPPALVTKRFTTQYTGNVIAGSVPADSTNSTAYRPPDGFTPPPGVVVFDGSQLLPDTSATLNIASTKYNCSGWLEPRMYLEGGAWFTQ